MKIRLLLICCVLFVMSSCSKDDADSIAIKKELFSGYAEKGPFVNGTSVTITELDGNLNQTGRTFSTTIVDNSGKFEQKSITFNSNYVQLRADGFYFNEVTGDNSSTQLTLYSVADISDESSVNVNVLTHLEKSRIEYLMSQKQLSFRNAKTQAQAEVLKIFGIIKPGMANSEVLSLANGGDDNAILLAASVILQGYRSTADMSELLAGIATDIKEDGALTHEALGSKLIDDARLLDLADIRANLIKRYQELGLAAEIPPFEKYVDQFIENTTFTPTKAISYPATSGYGQNILSDQFTTIKLPKDKEPAVQYSMAASLPAGTRLKVVLKGGVWGYRTMPNGPVNWTVSQYDDVKHEQTFTVTETGKSADINIQFSYSDTLSVEFYENNAATPTKVKRLYFE